MSPNNSIIVDSTIKGNTFIKESSDDSSNNGGNNGDVYHNSGSNSETKLEPETAINNGLKQAFIEARGKTFQALRALKLPVLPVAPRQDPHKYPARDKEGNIVYEKDGVTPKPLFNGKNPSYLDANGIPHIVNHSKYQSVLNTNADIKTWFVNSNTGIGTLGNKEITWIDIDAKNFDSVEACDTAFNELLEKYPILQKAWLEKTQSGGYRIGIRLSTEKTFTNFKLSPGGQHVGEALGVGRFTVLSPTVGVVGSYVCLSLPENYQLPVVENLESIGIFPMDYKASSNSICSNPLIEIMAETENLLEDLVAIESEPLDPSDISEEKNFDKLKITQVTFEKLISKNNLKAFQGDFSENDDKSKLLTSIARDVFGWENWLRNNLPELLTENAEDFIALAGNSFNYDSDKIDRILKSIERSSCLPAIHYKGGDDACRQKVLNQNNKKEKWRVVSTPEETILIDLFEEGKGDVINIAGTFSKYTGEGYYEKYKDAAVAKDVSQALRKCFSVTLKGEVRFSYSTDAKVKSSIAFSHANLFQEPPENLNLRCFKNCTMDFKNNQILEHSKKQYLTSRINHDYIPNVTEAPPNFLKFVEVSYGLEKLEMIQAMLGMYIDPTTPYQYFFNLIGDSGSGKGVMASIIENLFNRDAIASMQSFQDLATPQRRYQSLSGKSLLMFYDLEGFQDRSGWINSLVVNEPIDFTPLYSNASSSEKRNIRMLVCSVKPIHVGNFESGLLRRIIPLTTKGKIKDSDKDLGLKDKLEQEMSLIISWALSMSSEKRIDVLKNSENLESVREAKQEFRLSNSSVLHFADYALVPSTNWISSIKLYSAYQEHCIVFGTKAVKQGEFEKKLKADFPDLYKQSELRKNPETGKRDRSSLPSRMYVELSSAYKYDEYNSKFIVDKEELIDGSLNDLYSFKKENVKPTAQPVPTVQPVPTAQPVQAVPTVQPVLTPKDFANAPLEDIVVLIEATVLTPKDFANAPLEDIVVLIEAMRENLNDSPKDIKFVGDVFYLLGMREQNALEKDFPKTYKLMKDCVIEDICPPGF